MRSRIASLLIVGALGLSCGTIGPYQCRAAVEAARAAIKECDRICGDDLICGDIEERDRQTCISSAELGLVIGTVGCSFLPPIETQEE